ncbi:MAG: DUF2357 domain-containing protein [Solirubrobacteraceae bacterium]
MASIASLPLRDVTGASVGTLVISALPRSEGPADWTSDVSRSRSEPAIHLREASSYRYNVDLAGISSVRLEPAELFDPDDPSGVTGRLHTRQYVGDVLLTVIDAHGAELASGPILVKAAKLEHEREYHRMLREIADLAAEAVLQGFAPAATTTAIAPSRTPRLLYQQFAILQARLADEELRDAIAEVIHRPQRGWIAEIEWRPPGRPLKVGGDVARALTSPGRRVRAVNPVGALGTLPSKIGSQRSEETVDTVPNRFVKFALMHWRELAARLGDIVSSRSTAAYAVRGTVVVERVVESLDDVLSEPIFREIGQLQELPTSNQVLLKREGYRQIFSAFALIESSLDLRLELDDAIHPSQRNIASLYEYWTFIKLVEAVGDACEDPRAALKLFERDGDGLSLGLKRGTESRLQWDVPIAGRRLAVSIYFNRTFRATDEIGSDGSWSRAMVPDASVLVRPEQGRTRVETQRDLDVWLHFDAKYKLDWSSSQFQRARPEREEQAALEEEDEERRGASRRDDLLKMHAYRDAIRRSAGAYVLFPGTAEPLEFREYMELIPGLGAFPLRPGSDAGVTALRRFLGDVLLHAADQATAEERNRFWRSRIFHGRSGSEWERMVDFLDRPPADSPVLVGHMQDELHWQWTQASQRYVVRLARNDAGITFHAEELAAPLVLLSGVGRAVIFERHGAWTVVDEHDLEALGYPEPTDARALLCQLVAIEQQPAWLGELPLTDLLARAGSPGRPVLTYWSILVEQGREPRLRFGAPLDRRRARTDDRPAGPRRQEVRPDSPISRPMDQTNPIQAGQPPNPRPA